MKQELALFSIHQLNAVLQHFGMQPEKSKTIAIAKLGGIVNQGLVDMDRIKDIAMSATHSAAPAPSIEVDALRLMINDQQSTLDGVRRLAAQLDDKVRQLAKPESVDYTKIGRMVSQSVSDLLSPLVQKPDQFPAEIEQVAQAFPVVRTVKASEVFPGRLSYLDEDFHPVYFGDFMVDVWDDPAAPALVDDYIFDPAALHQTLIALTNLLPHNTWLGGERGTGKTEFVTQVAARLKRKLYRINFDEGLERSEFIGSNTIENGNVVWKPGTLAQAIQYPGAIILLDEVGFARAQNISPLHAVTERSPHRALVIAETGERIPVAVGVAFFAADNSTGHGDDSGNFAGVREQNSAFLDRFSFTIKFDYLRKEDEIDLIVSRTGLDSKVAEILVDFANTARKKAKAGLLTQPPSLRQLFAWAAAVKDGMPVATAFRNAILNKFPADCEAELRGIYSAMIDGNKMKEYLRRS